MLTQDRETAVLRTFTIDLRISELFAEDRQVKAQVRARSKAFAERLRKRIQELVSSEEQLAPVEVFVR